MTSFVIIKRFEPTFSISLPNECTNYYHMRRKIGKHKRPGMSQTVAFGGEEIDRQGGLEWEEFDW